MKDSYYVYESKLIRDFIEAVDDQNLSIKGKAQKHFEHEI
jgi:hypothetical protein